MWKARHLDTNRVRKFDKISSCGNYNLDFQDTEKNYIIML